MSRDVTHLWSVVRGVCCLFLIGLLVVIAVPDRAAASPVSSDVQAQRLLLLVIIVVLALVVGYLLYQFSQRTTHESFEQDTGRQEQSGPRPDVRERTLVPKILQEINQLPGSPLQRQRVAQAVSEVMAKTIETQVSVVRQELDDRYGQMVEEKQRAAAALQQKYTEALIERKQTVSVLESIAEGLVVVNTKGEVVMMNPAAERMLAVNQQQRVGTSLLDNLKDEQLVSLVRGSTENREIVLSAKQDSTKRIVRASNAVITDEDGRAVGMVAVLSDVTKQRELDQLKSEFVSKVSHELRTPLIAMQHALAILNDQLAGPLSEEQQKFVNLTQRNLQRLNGLINDLLDLSKLEARKLELRLESGAIGTIIRQVCESMDAWARSKGITIAERVPEDLPTALLDQARITQVLTNLIGNAIKFTPKDGRVTVEVKLAAGGQSLEVSVLDTGMGIAKEDLPKLFSKFQQVGERSTTDISGTGLGLAISKELVELHHGRIWAESDAHKRGARFSFTIPLQPPAAAASIEV